MLIKFLNTSVPMQVPVMETPEGPIFESNAIARYGLIPIPVSFADLHLSLYWPGWVHDP